MFEKDGVIRLTPSEAARACEGANVRGDTELALQLFRLVDASVDAYNSEEYEAADGEQEYIFGIPLSDTVTLARVQLAESAGRELGT